MKQIPLYEQIYEEIRAKIEERGYQVGDRLPSEKELSEQYHVSRITSKKAVELLAEEGLVTRIPGKGTFVIEHQETPKALEVPAGSIAEKKPLSDHTPVIGVVLDGFGALKRHIMNTVCLQMKACGLRISARRFRHTISIGENSSLQKTRRRLSNLSKSIRRSIPILQWNTVWHGLSIPA